MGSPSGGAGGVSGEEKRGKRDAGCHIFLKDVSSVSNKYSTHNSFYKRPFSETAPFCVYRFFLEVQQIQ